MKTNYAKGIPICIHREEKSVEGMAGIYHCKINPEVVHCCGECKWTCEDYQAPPQQLELF